MKNKINIIKKGLVFIILVLFIGTGVTTGITQKISENVRLDSDDRLIVNGCIEDRNENNIEDYCETIGDWKNVRLTNSNNNLNVNVPCIGKDPFASLDLIDDTSCVLEFSKNENNMPEPLGYNEYDYVSHIFTVADVVFFSYKDGTKVALYDSSGGLIWNNYGNSLNKGGHARVTVGTGVYTACGSEKFAILTGDPITRYVVGYYAMDQNGYGTSKELYTWVPRLYGHCSFIVFAYSDDTQVTVEYTDSGVDIASFTLDKGEHWRIKTLDREWLHITASKPVSALTCYDQGYFVPSSNGKWSGTEFYTYVSNIQNWPEDLSVLAYKDATSVTVKDSNTGTVIWSGTLNSGQAYVKKYPYGADKFFTITSSKPVTVSVQPWKSWTSNYHQGAYVADSTGTMLGTDLIASTLNGGYLYVLAYKDNTNIVVYNSITGAYVASYTLDVGDYVQANPGNGLWRIISNQPVSAYSGYGEWNADFSPVEFREITTINVDFTTHKCYESFPQSDNFYRGENLLLAIKVTSANGKIIRNWQSVNVKLGDNELPYLFHYPFNPNLRFYKIPDNTPLGTRKLTVEVVTSIGSGTTSKNIVIMYPIDTDKDGLKDFEEDVNQNKRFDPPGETNWRSKDTDNDWRNDKIDPFPWLTTNRKSLVLGITEYDYLFGEPDKLTPDLSMCGEKNPENYYDLGYFEKLGFIDKSWDFGMIDDDNDDGNVITFDEVTSAIKKFKNSLSSNDVAVIQFNSHGSDQGIFGYWMCYGDDLYSAGKCHPWDDRCVTEQVKRTGKKLDFFWLDTCHSWKYRRDDQVGKLDAGKIIFWGNQGVSYGPALNSYEFFDGILNERYIEDIVDNVRFTWYNDEKGKWFNDVRMDDRYSGKMDLMNPFLAGEGRYLGAMNLQFITGELALSNQENYETIPVHKNENASFIFVDNVTWDSDGDGLNDVVTISWDVDNPLENSNVTVAASVYNSSNKLVRYFVYGPYYCENPIESQSFDFYANETDLYNIKIMLWNSSFNVTDYDFQTNINLFSGVGNPYGKEIFTKGSVTLLDLNNDGYDDTFNITWNLDTSLSEEDITVLISVDEYGIQSDINIDASVSYTIYNSTDNYGEFKVYIGNPGLYSVKLYVTDSNEEIKDNLKIIQPLQVSTFTNNFVDYGIDNNTDGTFNYLAIDGEINITGFGNFTIKGSLYDNNGNLLLTSENSTTFEKGFRTFQLKFNGESLFKIGEDGPYVLKNLILSNQSRGILDIFEDSYVTATYSISDFDTPVIIFSNLNDFVVDTDANGLDDYLRIEATIENKISSNYEIGGFIYNQNRSFVCTASNALYLDHGVYSVNLDFNGSMISYYGHDGPYILDVYAYLENVSVNRVKNLYVTGYYSASQFETDSINLYHFINVNMPHDMKLGDMYMITADITNPCGRILENLQVSLDLPSEIISYDPLKINIDELHPYDKIEVAWLIEAIAPGYGQFIFNLTSVSIQNVSINQSVYVHHIPLDIGTDKSQYEQDDIVIITIALTNNNPKVSYLNVSLNLTIHGMGITENYPISLDYLDSYETRNFALTWDSTNHPPGRYTVTIKLLENTQCINETSITFKILGDYTPPEITAEFTPIEVEEEEGLFELNFSAIDDWDPEPVTIAFMLLPTTNASSDLELHIEDEIKIQFDYTEEDELEIVEIKGSDPQALWQNIQTNGGIEVENGQQVYIELETDIEVYTNLNLLNIEGYLPTLRVNATDASDNTAEIFVQPIFSGV